MNHSHTKYTGTKKSLITGLRTIATALLGFVLFGATIASAANSNGALPEFHLPSFDVEALGIDITLPIPIKTTAPAAHKNLDGTQVTMSFYISKSGKVTLVDDNASPYNNEQFELACLMHRKLRTWRFDPARDSEGNAISVKVKLPIVVVTKGSVASSRLASISFNRPLIVAVSKR